MQMDHMKDHQGDNLDTEVPVEPGTVLPSKGANRTSKRVSVQNDKLRGMSDASDSKTIEVRDSKPESVKTEDNFHPV